MVEVPVNSEVFAQQRHGQSRPAVSMIAFRGSSPHLVGDSPVLLESRFQLRNEHVTVARSKAGSTTLEHDSGVEARL